MGTIQQQRNKVVLARLIALSEKDEEFADELSDSLDHMIEGLAKGDAFGTECSTDPRGDARNGWWDMWTVEGVDR